MRCSASDQTIAENEEIEVGSYFALGTMENPSRESVNFERVVLRHSLSPYKLSHVISAVLSVLNPFLLSFYVLLLTYC